MPFSPMARILAIANHKGGSGKTTTAVNLAAGLQRHGYSVLLVDLDSQANASDTIGAPRDAVTTFEMLATMTAPEPCHYIGRPGNSFDLLPGSAKLDELPTSLTSQGDAFRLSRLLGEYSDYDFIVIDTPPALSVLTLGALIAADDLIVPLEPNALELRGVAKMAGTVASLAPARSKPLRSSVLLVKYDGRKSLHRLTAASIRKGGASVLETKIRQCVALAESPSVGLDIFQHAPGSNGAKDYEALTLEYLQQLGFSSRAGHRTR